MFSPGYRNKCDWLHCPRMFIQSQNYQSFHNNCVTRSLSCNKFVIYILTVFKKWQRLCSTTIDLLQTCTVSYSRIIRNLPILTGKKNMHRTQKCIYGTTLRLGVTVWPKRLSYFLSYFEYVCFYSKSNPPLVDMSIISPFQTDIKRRENITNNFFTRTP